MMKKMMRSVLLAGLMAFCLQIQAQEKLSFDKVYSVSLRNSGTIQSDGNVKGYFFLFQSDKIDRKTNEYTLQLLDANLNKVKDIKFQDSKNIILMESAYNGNSIVFCFYDGQEKTLDYRVYGMDGKQVATYNKVLGNKSNEYFKMQMALNNSGQSDESENKTIYDITGKGFVAITPLVEDRKYTYEVNFYSSEKKRSWSYNPEESGKVMVASYLGTNDSVAVLEVLTRDKLLSKKMESTLVGINLTNGRQAFETRTQDGARQLYPMNITKVNGSSDFLLIGPYFDGGDRVLQSVSQGLGVWLMDTKGKIVKSKYSSYEKDMSKYLKLNSKGQVENFGYVYYHTLMQTGDGKFFAVGEGYMKKANVAGIISSIATQSYSGNTTKLVITDMLMLELNEKFEVTNAKVYEKNKNHFDLNGADFSNPHTLALMAKMMGYFDYSYTMMGKTKDNFVTAYTDYERSKEYKGLTFNTISYADGKVTTDKINLKSKASSIQVYPGKPGYILIAEYFKKDKRLDMRLEKTN